ncbi:MAG TPA: hypothetical protein PKH39_00250 [Woeseiaceae bacterium]|nr:hypothetical protein [Woeseiaceae bacterium]
MKNTLQIRSEHWPDVTATPHFAVVLNYEGLTYECNDIYFDNLSDIVPELQEQERTRKGQVVLDGGFRFQMIVHARSSGGIDLNFRTESDATFPGKCVIEGCFSVDGEHAANTIGALTRLFDDGDDFVL